MSRLAPQLARRHVLTVARPALAASSARRFQSSGAVSDPKQEANALINAIPGSSVVSKTGSVVLGVGALGYLISEEVIVWNDEALLLAAASIFAVLTYRGTREPFNNWADNIRGKIRDTMAKRRNEHAQEVRERRTNVEDLSDVVGLTDGLFALSKETAKLEHEAFSLRQQSALDSEIKATLDSWVRFEAQQREGEQKDLVRSVTENVRKQLDDPKTKRDILNQAITDVEELVKQKSV